MAVRGDDLVVVVVEVLEQVKEIVACGYVMVEFVRRVAAVSFEQ